MTKIAEIECRKAFEEWADRHVDLEYVLHLEKKSENRKRYLHNHTNAAWAAWKACERRTNAQMKAYWERRKQKEGV